MINNLKIGLRSKIAIVGVLDTKEATTYCCLILKKKGKQLSIVDFKEQLSSIDEVKEVVKELPVALTFLGNKILHTNENDLYINNSSEDYYTTNYDALNGKKITALVRKNYIKEVRDNFQEKDFLIVDVFIGALEINILYKNLFDKKQIQIFDLELKYDDEDCVEIKKTTPSFNATTEVANETKNNLEIFLFAIGLSFYNENDRIFRTQDDIELSNNKKEIYYKSQFEFITIVASILFAFFTLINFAFNGFYTYQGNHLNSQVYHMKNKQMELDHLLLEKERKTRFINISGFLNTNYISFYINEITAVIPRSILLSSVNVLPSEDKSINVNKKININDRLIKVIGVSREDKSFNKWIDTLQTKGWVKKVSITKYEQKNNRNTNFEIEMELE